MLAFAAFLIALVSALYQLTTYLKGAKVQLFHPDRIMLEMRQNPGDTSVLGVVAPMSYVNTGGAGYNGVVRRELVRFQLDRQKYVYAWQEFVSSTSQGKQLILTTQEEAHPFQVNGGSAKSHETRFTPDRPRCPNQDRQCLNSNFLTTDDFFEKAHQLDQMRFEFVADVFSKDRIRAACVVDLHPGFWDELGEKGWATLPCWKSP